MSCNNEKLFEYLEGLHSKIDNLIVFVNSVPTWISLRSIAEENNIYIDTLRKRLFKPELFEPEVDYKKITGKWYVHKNVISRLTKKNATMKSGTEETVKKGKINGGFDK